MLWVLIRITSPQNRLAEAVLMSTHNIGFYEDLTKMFFELSSNMHLFLLLQITGTDTVPTLKPSFHCGDELVLLKSSNSVNISLS